MTYSDALARLKAAISSNRKTDKSAKSPSGTNVGSQHRDIQNFTGRKEGALSSPITTEVKGRKKTDTPYTGTDKTAESPKNPEAPKAPTDKTDTTVWSVDDIDHDALARSCRQACEHTSLDPRDLHEWLVAQRDPEWLLPAAVRRWAEVIEAWGWPGE